MVMVAEGGGDGCPVKMGGMVEEMDCHGGCWQGRK